MLYYNSLHPEWNDTDTAVSSSQTQEISDLLSIITMNHYRNTTNCFDALEQAGIILGCGGFEAALIQPSPLGQIELSPDQILPLVTAAANIFSFPLWYCFSVSGKLYILVCSPRLQENSEGCGAVKQQIYNSFADLTNYLLPKYPKIRIILSDLQFEEAGIFRCFNNLHHAMEYYDFRNVYSPLIQLDSEQQLHDAFIGDMSAYRQFSVSIAEQIVRDTCEISKIAQQIVQRQFYKTASLL